HFSDSYYPRDVLKVKTGWHAGESKSLHPTQKSVSACEYFIKTYTNEGELILDNCMGSGTTAVACINTNRHFLGFELEKEYFELACKRIANAKTEKESKFAFC
ncbi:site-specific DNA-methyltransferase, partial [Selenomonas sp.]|uniref:site-specific DNA-methyltransferase n=1 Tax=Selenomonas sp. TaxID=2053611 RepID=UPI002A75B368